MQKKRLRGPESGQKSKAGRQGRAPASMASKPKQGKRLEATCKVMTAATQLCRLRSLLRTRKMRPTKSLQTVPTGIPSAVRPKISQSSPQLPPAQRCLRRLRKFERVGFPVVYPNSPAPAFSLVPSIGRAPPSTLRSPLCPPLSPHNATPVGAS